MSVRSRRARLLGAAGAALLVAGLIAVVVAVLAQRSAPQPSASAARPVDVTPTGQHSGGVPGPGRRAPQTAGPDTRGPILRRSTPTQLRIPAIGVNTSLERIGLTSNGQIATPPLNQDSHAYWLTVSPAPGELGPATIIGHVDSAASGPGVFFHLGALHQRQPIFITLADGATAKFEVEHVDEYNKARFPTQQVYGNINHAGLRLITCGGTFNTAAHSYESNIVVYAALVSSHTA